MEGHVGDRYYCQGDERVILGTGVILKGRGKGAFRIQVSSEGDLKALIDTVESKGDVRVMLKTGGINEGEGLVRYRNYHQLDGRVMLKTSVLNYQLMGGSC